MKRLGIILAASVLLSLLLVAASLNAIPDTRITQESIDSATSVTSSVSLEAVNAGLNRSLIYQARAEDAQLYIRNIQEEIGAIIFEFRLPPPEGAPFQLFYSTEDDRIEEIYSIKGRIGEDRKQLAIPLPEFHRYDILRLDIDANYQLKSIAVIDRPEVYAARRTELSAVLEDFSRFPLGQFLLCLCILLAEGLLIAWKLDALKRWCADARRYVRDNRSGLLLGALLCLGGVALSVVVWAAMLRAGWARSRSGYTLFCFGMVGLAACALVALRRQLARHPERGFAVIALCVGLMFAVAEPSASKICWDDETHYARSVRLSYGNTDFITMPESALVKMGLSNALSVENKIATAELLDGMPFVDKGYAGNINDLLCIYVPAYLPAAAGIWLTRMLGFSASNTIVAGRIGNLLCYVAVAYLAIRQLRFGRLFAASLCLMPTILFQAANYSYDPFCIAFMLLGTCIWLSAYQRREAKMTGPRTCAMLLAFILGILVKAVYFPFMLIALFLPADRFGSRGAARRYRWAIVITAAALAATFVVPFLMSRGTASIYNDVRGGDNISAADQVAYILGNPLSYAAILFKYLFTEFFNLNNILSHSGGCIRAFSYLSEQGVAFSDGLVWTLLGLFLIAWLLSLDRYERPGQGVAPWVKAIACVVTLGTLCIAATSLYCSFTAVGSDTISGFQERYMLPLMIPLLVLLRPVLTTSGLKLPERLNAWVLLAEGAVILVGMTSFIRCYL